MEIPRRISLAQSVSTLRRTSQLTSRSKACYDQLCSSGIPSLYEFGTCTNLFSDSPAECCTADDPSGCFAYFQESLDCAADLVAAESSVLAENGYELATSTDYGSSGGGLAKPTPTAGMISSVDASELGGVATDAPYFSNVAAGRSPTETAGSRKSPPPQQGGGAMPNSNGGQSPPPHRDAAVRVSLFWYAAMLMLFAGHKRRYSRLQGKSGAFLLQSRGSQTLTWRSHSLLLPLSALSCFLELLLKQCLAIQCSAILERCRGRILDTLRKPSGGWFLH